jgi:hypothetical protein
MVPIADTAFNYLAGNNDDPIEISLATSILAPAARSVAA